MRILVFHGYLLAGTGSNVYNARLVEALVRAGHEVHLLCQERHPEEHPFLSAAGDWDTGMLRIRRLGDRGAGGHATLYRPALGGLLPVYVADEYEGVQAKTFAACTDAEIARYVQANVDAVAEVARLARAELALANHLVMGPVILARGLAGGVPYAVKVHGSALEYTVKPQPERFLAPAREGLAPARGVLVGSRHTAESLWRSLEQPGLSERTRLGPPGVDVRRFVPREPEPAAERLDALVGRLRTATAEAERAMQPATGSFARDSARAGAALAGLRVPEEPLVAYVGKLIVSKGVDLAVAAWPLVLERRPRARLVIVGFGAYEEALAHLVRALGDGDLQRARRIAEAGRSLEQRDMPAKPLRHLLAFLDGLQGDARDRYLAAAAALPRQVVMVGRLEHEELAELLPACSALLAPSTFPEAFGMVAAEAAACGVLPIVARHSGLGEVSEALATAVPGAAAPWLSFEVDDMAVSSLAACVLGWLAVESGLRSRTRDGLVATVRERWSWDRVCEGVIAAARGELQALPEP